MKHTIKELVDFQSFLKPTDLVVDIGGYMGDYTQEINNRFGCKIMLFEPNPEAFKQCEYKFNGLSNIELHPFALGDSDNIQPLYLKDNGSSLFKEWTKNEDFIKVKVKKLSDLLDNKIPTIIKINCEGGEYDIINDLYNKGILKQVPEILIQFHLIKSFKEKARAAFNLLNESHNRLRLFKWDLWRKNDE